jgi:Protein of unknown function (DUF1553)/Protein of unknown function (DUF1549)
MDLRLCIDPTEAMTMYFRLLGIALLGIVATTLLPCPARAQDPNSPQYKQEVLNLSRWIDSYLERRWKELDVHPAPLAEDAIFLRRLSLDLTGRIPELLEIVDFTDKTNTRTDKHWNAAEIYLNTDYSTRHFANFWRTVIIGRSSNQQFQFFYPQFEQWLEDRIRKNTPLDDMTKQILTVQNGNQNINQFGGPGMQGLSPAAFVAVNEGKAENIAGASARVFLGVKIECAQCHKHPFAKWTKEQFWEYAAFFSGPNQFVQPVPGKQKGRNFIAGREIPIPETDKIAKAKFLTGKEPNWGAFSDSRKVLAEWVTSPENPYFARAMADHLWSYFFGVSLLEPILEPNDDSPVTHPELMDKLASELIKHKFDQKFVIRALVHTNAYRRSSGGPELATKEDYHLFLRMPIRALTPEQIYDSLDMATRNKRETNTPTYDPRFAGNPFAMNNTPRGEFLNKFGTQDRRYDPQTSILQALFMMNGKFMSERTRADGNDSIKSLAEEARSTEKKLTSMYYLTLSRPPRAEEVQRLVPYLDNGGPSHNIQRAYEDVYWTLLNSPEFLLNH